MIYFDGALTREEYERRRNRRSENKSALRQGHHSMTERTQQWVNNLHELLKERGSMDAQTAREELGVPVRQWEQVKRAAVYGFLFYEDDGEVGVL